LIEQTARVTRAVDDKAWVSLGGQSGCPACDAGQGCGAGLFGRLLRRHSAEFELDNRIDARPGQAVVVGIPERAYLATVFSIYGLPLLAGLAGAALGHYIGVAYGLSGSWLDLATLLAGLALALTSWLAWSRLTHARLAGVELQLLAAAPASAACPVSQQVAN
jgi:sigma-E factor negative regulatory protein RseC